MLDRCQASPGAGNLRALLARQAGPQITKSRAERLALKLIREAGLPAPLTNVRPQGYTVDMFWPDRRLIVETDGFSFHGHRRAFESDRRRDAVLVAAGYRVIRITWRQLTEQPLRVIAILAQALGRGC
jgi:very-short-patch-repair endonuclease